MNKNFYGYCTNLDNENGYQVIVQDEDIVNIKAGDLLTVYFSMSQDAGDQPRITLYLNDTDNEISISTDGGLFIKTLDIDTDGIDKAWEARETIIFALTKRGESSIYYFELINSAPATTTVYGVTKLFNTENLYSVLGNDRTHDMEAITPITLKKFYDDLMNRGDIIPSEDSDEEAPSLGLNWTPAIEGEETDVLGTLSLNSGIDSINITYPISELITQQIGGYEAITHTGQLFNNGAGAPDNKKTQEIGTFEPYITRMIPNNLYFTSGQGLYYTTGSNEYARIILNQVDNNSNFLVLGGNGTTKVKINSPLDITGRTTITSGGIAVTGNSNISGSLTSTGVCAAPSFTEGGTSLVDKYSKKITSETKQTSIITIAANNYLNGEFSAAFSGKKAIGLVGYNISSNFDGGWGASYCMPYAMMFYATKGNQPNERIVYNIRNMASKEVKIKIDFKILYVNL